MVGTTSFAKSGAERPHRGTFRTALTLFRMNTYEKDRGSLAGFSAPPTIEDYKKQKAPRSGARGKPS
jgi:hypothetical protein